jgi:hypothetical protein
MQARKRARYQPGGHCENCRIHQIERKKSDDPIAKKLCRRNRSGGTKRPHDETADDEKDVYAGSTNEADVRWRRVEEHDHGRREPSKILN